MAMTSRRQLSALLAMPASIRPLLLVASASASASASATKLSPSPSSPSSSRASVRQFSVSSPQHKKLKYHNVAAFSVPEFRTSQPTEITPDQLLGSSFLPDAPDTPLEEGLTALFTKNPATFYYSAHDFYYLRKNTRIPEVCILGRSNVGKSSFLNALANRQTNELARVSKSAGKTRTMNAYGFGPPAKLPKDLTGAQYKGKEDLPRHTFYLVDMPGYGFASLKEWGRNITLYLSRRAAVKGAILLIDAEAGAKATDWDALKLLSNANLPIAFVITKADKVKLLDQLRITINTLLGGIRNTELSLAADNKWSWDRELYVTAVGAQSPLVVNATVTTARLAVARLAGLVEDKRPKEKRDQKWGGNVVSFEDLMYTSSEATTASAPQRPDSHTASRPRNASNQQTRAFHTSRTLETQYAGPPPPGSTELQKILDEFWAELKASENRPRDRVRKNKLELESRIPRPRDREKVLLHRDQRRFPEQTRRVQEVKANRLVREERRLQIEDERRNRGLDEANAAAWEKQRSVEDVRDEDEYENEDDYGIAARSRKTGGFAKGSGSKGKGARKSKRTKASADKDKDLDPFEAQFLEKMEPADNDDGGGRGASF